MMLYTEHTSRSCRFAARISSLFAVSSSLITLRAMIRSDEAMSWEASKAALAALAISNAEVLLDISKR